MSEMSDSGHESSGEADESSGDEQQAPWGVRQQAGKGAGKHGAPAAAAAAAASRRPLAPSSAANRRVQ
jgi:hypothetical protein